MKKSKELKKLNQIKSAKNIVGFIISIPTDFKDSEVDDYNEYYFRIYDKKKNKNGYREYRDYKIEVEDLEVKILSNYYLLDNKRMVLDYNLKILWGSKNGRKNKTSTN